MMMPINTPANHHAPLAFGKIASKREVGQVRENLMFSLRLGLPKPQKGLVGIYDYRGMDLASQRLRTLHDQREMLRIESAVHRTSGVYGVLVHHFAGPAHMAAYVNPAPSGIGNLLQPVIKHLSTLLASTLWKPNRTGPGGEMRPLDRVSYALANNTLLTIVGDPLLLQNLPRPQNRQIAAQHLPIR